MFGSSHSRRRYIFVHVLAFLCGGCVMSVALVESRVMGPHYGVTLFLWTALVSVTLFSLAGGFIVGGHLADRNPDAGQLRTPLVVAGVWLWAVGWLLPTVFALSSSLGLRLSMAVTALFLFGPPLTAMAAVTPFLLRQVGPAPEQAGRAAGHLLAMSALGSVCGMLLCGYYLIPRVGVDVVLKGLAFALVSLGLLTGRMSAGTGALTLLFLPLTLLFLWLVPAPPPHAAIEGELLRVDSPYSFLTVAEQGSVRRLQVDGRQSGTVDIRDGQSFAPLHPVLLLPAAFRTGPGRVLLIGLGDGSLARAYAGLGWSVEVVEVDPALIRIAYGYFGLKPTEASVFQADGRAYLRLGTGQFDAIVLDAFPEGQIPYHLASREAVALARARLAPDGVLLLHAQTFGLEETGLSALASTLHEQFPQVWVLPLSEARDKPSRKVLLACQELPEICRPEAAGPYAQLVWSKRQGRSYTSPVITDSRNPLEWYWEKTQPAGREAGL